jgi:hypothetical protein
MFLDTTPFMIALVVIFCTLVCVIIWNNINAPQAQKKAPPIEPGPSRTREILARFSEFYTNLNPEGEIIFDIGILPDPKQHIVHALYVGYDESENEEERSAIERGLRAIVTFQERVGEDPLKKNVSQTEQILEEITPNLERLNATKDQYENIGDDDEFRKIAIVRDQELELHFQHLKIESAEA